MEYKTVVKATFIERPNRFIAKVNLNGSVLTVHVKNTGRCKELLVPSSTVYLEKAENNQRKTPYDLIAVEKITDGRKVLINMDSQAPNKVAAEWIRKNTKMFPHITLLKPEYTLNDSRFDFYVEYEDEKSVNHKMLIEVKGVTLEENKTAMFPDAPTERGLKHVTELSEYAGKKKYECTILFIIQMKGCNIFTPNKNTHPQFAEALIKAKANGVNIIAVDCNVTPSTLTTDSLICVKL